MIFATNITNRGEQYVQFFVGECQDVIVFERDGPFVPIKSIGDSTTFDVRNTTLDVLVGQFAYWQTHGAWVR